MTGSFLQEPPESPQARALYDEDLADSGYVWNVSRLWAHQPGTLKGLFELMSGAFTPSGLTFRQRGILVTAAASALGAQPDAELARSLPGGVREAVTYGRPVAQASAI